VCPPRRPRLLSRAGDRVGTTAGRVAGATALALTLLSDNVAAHAEDGECGLAAAQRAAAAANATRPVDAALLEGVGAVLEHVRGLGLMAPVESRWVTRDRLEAHLQLTVESELPPTFRAAIDRWAQAFGLVGRGESYVDALLGVLGGEVAGVYDQKERVLMVLDELPEPLRDATLSHELFHAIQDQRWPLDPLIGEARWITDAGAAVQALIEGDATLAALAYAMGDGEALRSGAAAQALLARTLAAGATRPDGVAAALWESILFPYVDGAVFAAAVGAGPTWAGLDAAYLAPPLSTEQILHPERYTERDVPTWLAFEARPPSEWRRTIVDVLGEQYGRSVLAQVLTGVVTESAVARALEGWDGDRMELWSHGVDRDVIVWAHVWDSVDDADAFQRVAERLSVPWAATAVVGTAAGDHGAATWAEGTGGVLWTERWGDLTLVVADRGGDATAAERWAVVDGVVRDAWRTLSRSEYPPLR